MVNLIESLMSEMNRVREVITLYESIPGGAGMFAAALMRIQIQNAEKAIAEGDTIQMMVSYTGLTEIEE